MAPLLSKVQPSVTPARFVVSAPRCPAWCSSASHGAGCSFRVAWEINPHMHVGSVDPIRAAIQHRTLVELLRVSGASVDVVPFIHGAYDSVFVKDNALLLRSGPTQRALLARPRHAERSLEQAHRRCALVQRGFAVHQEEGARFEGGDIVLLPNGRGALLGTGFRSERGAARHIAAFLDAPVQALDLCDARLYHLDTALAVLRDGTTAFCPEAFTASSRRWIEHHLADRSLLRVPLDDACHFSLNVIEVGSHIILGGPSSTLESALRERGYTVHVPELDQFRAAGGSAACLVAQVHDLATVTLSDTAAMRSTAA